MTSSTAGLTYQFDGIEQRIGDSYQTKVMGEIESKEWQSSIHAIYILFSTDRLEAILMPLIQGLINRKRNKKAIQGTT